ncbi:hypothetical protein [Brevundimonas sp. Root1279]|uniref:hypothetical protein n=1 Tax=Brevundimonas sp. Root1279 TaxID=1736443 RepID=UPI0006F59D16|nr:hypothetical protein [Brevundimonas sp. Root1279]KQW79739.1 hypothetical protein ASC65_14420 [Brevundimonas sp. Root1279]
MNKLSHREHSRLAGELIEACGGLEEAARACRVKKSALSGYQNPHDASTMPADVIADLEAYIARPIYSAALFDLCKAKPITGCLKELAFDLAQESMDVVSTVREALADGRLSPNDMDLIAAAERDAEEALERVRGVRRAIEAATPSPLRAA